MLPAVNLMLSVSEGISIGSASVHLGDTPSLEKKKHSSLETKGFRWDLRKWKVVFLFLLLVNKATKNR